MIGRVLAALAAFAVGGAAEAAPAPLEADRAAPTAVPYGVVPRPTIPVPVPADPPSVAAPADRRPAATAARPPAPVAKAVDIVPEPVRLPDDPRPTLSPDTFLSTRAAAEQYRAMVEAGGWPAVPAEATRLKPGEEGPAVAALRRRLAATADLPGPDMSGTIFDEVLAAALRRFQARHGLEETGIVGPRTLTALNVPAASRLRQLQASMTRLVGSKFAFGERYIAVNIPSATVEAVERGQVAHRYVAVVGKPDRASPQLETRVVSVNFNPTWTVPTSLIRKDIIPHVRKDPNYLARMKIRLFDAAGQEVDPGTIDWSTERAAAYTIRQDSGLDNSLGEVRIDMPNRYSVYMHDTPSKRLFARTARAQSSGCVRVSGVKGLAGWLLEGTPGPNGAGSAWGQIEVETAVAAGRRIDVRLARPIPVAWVYLTGFATPDGVVQFRDDIYGLDDPAGPPVAAATSAARPPPAAAGAIPRPASTLAVATGSVPVR